MIRSYSMFYRYPRVNHQHLWCGFICQIRSLPVAQLTASRDKWYTRVCIGLKLTRLNTTYWTRSAVLCSQQWCIKYFRLFTRHHSHVGPSLYWTPFLNIYIFVVFSVNNFSQFFWEARQKSSVIALRYLNGRCERPLHKLGPCNRKAFASSVSGMAVVLQNGDREDQHLRSADRRRWCWTNLWTMSAADDTDNQVYNDRLRRQWWQRR